MANEMRDRLVEMIFQGDEKCSEQDCRDCKHHGNEFCGFEHIADYLIENGVVVPPCKVGGVVYSVCDCINRPEKLFITSLHQYKNYISYICTCYTDILHRFCLYDNFIPKYFVRVIYFPALILRMCFFIMNTKV